MLHSRISKLKMSQKLGLKNVPPLQALDWSDFKNYQSISKKDSKNSPKAYEMQIVTSKGIKICGESYEIFS